MAYDPRDLEEIARRISIVDVVGQYLTLKRSGSGFVALCPFHQEKTPSFHVNPVKNFYYCFGCGAHGDIFKFVMEYEKLSFPEAVRKLAGKAGLNLRESEDREDARQHRHRVEVILEILRRVTKTFRHFLLSDRNAWVREVLRRRRIDPDVEEAFQIGYLPREPGWLWNFLRKKHYDEDILRDTGLFTRNGTRCLFENRIVFPIVNRRGEVVSFGGRLLEGEGPKYLNGPETPVFQKRQVLYGFFQSLKEARLRKEFLITEGYVDVLALFSAGLGFAGAPLGTAVTADHLEVFRDQGWRLKILMDNDPAGLNAAWKVFQLAEQKQITTEVVLLPTGVKDAAEALERLGSDELHRLVTSTEEPMSSLLPRLVGLRENRAEGVKRGLAMLRELLQLVPVEVRRDILVETFAKTFNLNPDSVRHDTVDRTPRSRSRLRTPEATLPEVPSPSERIPGSEWILVGCFLDHPELYQTARSEITPEDFEHPRAREILRRLDKLLNRGYHIERGISHEEYRDLLPEDLLEDFLTRQKRGEFRVNPRNIVEDGIKRLKLRKLSQKKTQIQSRMLACTPEESRELLQTLEFLDREMRTLKGGQGEAGT